MSQTTLRYIFLKKKCMKQRIEYIDLAKGICIFLVVLFHELCYYQICSTLYMVLGFIVNPLFFILSGIFFNKYDGFVDFAIRKTNKILVPFFSFWLLTCVFQDYLFGNMGMVKLSREIFYNETVHYNYAIWFLLCLFEINIMFYLLKKIRSTIILIIMVCLFCISGVLLNYFNVNLPCYIDNAITALPFFAYGYFLNHYTRFLTIRPNYKRDCATICACSLLYYLLCEEVTSRKDYTWVLKSFKCYSIGILGTMMILIFARLLKKVQPFSYWGRYSIVILCIHFALLPHIKRVLDRTSIDHTLAFVMNLLLTMILCTICIPLLKRYIPYIIAQKDLLKYKRISHYTVEK